MKPLTVRNKTMAEVNPVRRDRHSASAFTRPPESENARVLRVLDRLRLSVRPRRDDDTIVS